MSPCPCGAGLVVAGLTFWWRFVQAGRRHRGGGVLLTGVWRPLARVWWAGVVLSNGCERVSFLPGVCGGLPGLDPRLASLALVLWCTLVRRAVLCCALLCCAKLFRAVLRGDLLCCAVPCRVVPWCVLPWRGGLRRAAPRRAVLCCVVSCRGVPCRCALHGGALCCCAPCCPVL